MRGTPNTNPDVLARYRTAIKRFKLQIN